MTSSTTFPIAAASNADGYATNVFFRCRALCFVERYPQREQELVRRIKEGRVYVSPYLCNSLWGFQSAEGMIRTFYPFRRLERQWGISTNSAHHIELPSLPWGVPTILAGCGVRHLSVPYLDYDSTFKNLKVPPFFLHAGPDGNCVTVVMDRWACSTANYTQGASLLKTPQAIQDKWITHYARLGHVYPFRSILACGTHGDIKPNSGIGARAFADAIIQYNATLGAPAKLVNATYPQFWEAFDKTEKERPFLPSVSGSFGHSWDLWPVTLAKYAADSREGERRFLAGETLLAVMGHGSSHLDVATRKELQRAEWCWAMLSDHAWNGTSDENKRHNADLRRRWSEELLELADNTVRRGWSAGGIERSPDHVSLFNSLSVPRNDLVRLPLPTDVCGVVADGRHLSCQVVQDEGQNLLCFVSPQISGFGYKRLELDSHVGSDENQSVLIASPTLLESPFYRLRVDQKTGGISCLVHKATGMELVTPQQPHTLCQSVYFDGDEHTLTDVTSEVIALGPVLARVEVRGVMQGIRVTNGITVYSDLDRVDFDVQVHKPLVTKQERLCHVFPLLDEKATLRVSTASAIVRPRTQPEGDLLPGADTSRFAVQEFLNFARDDVSVTVVPLDAFALRLDLKSPAFEVLGNDQNYREVTKDQHGVKEFRFRYSIRAHSNAYVGSAAVGFARTAATPLLHVMGRLPSEYRPLTTIAMDPKRVFATCLKPADDKAVGGQILRLWEVEGRTGPTTIAINGYRRANVTDLLERDGDELPIVDGRVTLDLKAHGYRALRLISMQTEIKSE